MSGELAPQSTYLVAHLIRPNSDLVRHPSAQPAGALSPVALSLKTAAGVGVGGGGGEDQDEGDIALTALLTQGGDQALTQARLDISTFFDSYATRASTAAPAPFTSDAYGGEGDQDVGAGSSTSKMSRIQACRCFAELLTLHSRGFIKIVQGGPYDDLEIMVTTSGVDRCTRERFAAAVLTQVQSLA